MTERINETQSKKEYRSLCGIAADSSLTVEKFLEWKREERQAEYERDIRRGWLRPDGSIPNAETIATIREAKAGIDMHECESFEQLIKELNED
jgi:hypothetical protein